MGSEEVGFAEVVGEGLVIVEERVSGSRISARKAMEGLPILAGVDGECSVKFCAGLTPFPAAFCCEEVTDMSL